MEGAATIGGTSTAVVGTTAPAYMPAQPALVTQRVMSANQIANATKVKDPAAGDPSYTSRFRRPPPASASTSVVQNVVTNPMRRGGGSSSGSNLHAVVPRARSTEPVRNPLTSRPVQTVPPSSAAAVAASNSKVASGIFPTSP